jgi:hypothetical protein
MLSAEKKKRAGSCVTEFCSPAFGLLSAALAVTPELPIYIYILFATAAYDCFPSHGYGKYKCVLWLLGVFRLLRVTLFLSPLRSFFLAFSSLFGPIILSLYLVSATH